MSGVENFSSQEALLIIGELTVQLRRTQSDLEICQEQLQACMGQNAELHNDLEISQTKTFHHVGHIEEG